MKRLAHGASRRIGLFHELRHFVSERQRRNCLRAVRSTCQSEPDASHRVSPFASGPSTSMRTRCRVRIEGPGMVHFGEIVIFGRQPEHRDGRRALLGQLPGEFCRR